MQTTSNFYDLISKKSFGVAKDVFDNTAPLDACNDMFNHDPNARDDLILCFLCLCQLLTFGLFLGLINRDARRVITLKPHILKEIDLGRENELLDVTDALVVDATGIRLAQVAHQALFYIDDEIVFERMPFFYRCIDPFAQLNRLAAAPVAPCHRS